MLEDIFSLDKLLPMATMAFIYWACRREVKNRDQEIGIFPNDLLID